MQDFKIVVSILFISVVLSSTFKIFGYSADKVIECKPHKVICVSRYGILLGCMSEDGSRVSDAHAETPHWR